MLDHIALLQLATATTQTHTASGGIELSSVDFETIFKLGFVVVIIGVFGVVSAMKTVARERTRREIAAYIAEGSMTPEQGERLIKAKFKGDC